MKLRLADNSQMPGSHNLRLILNEDGCAIGQIIGNDLAEKIVKRFNEGESDLPCACTKKDKSNCKSRCGCDE